jgi:hypothetical protein
MDAANMTPLPLDYRTLRVAMGALALITAVAAGLATTIAAGLFGGLTALALSAGAGLCAGFELADSEPNRVGRAAAWAVLTAGWISAASMLLGAPQGYLDALRPLVSVLIAGGAALRVWRWWEHTDSDPQCIAGPLVSSLLALTATWSGAWLPFGGTPATAVSIACALELFGTGGLWLAETFLSRPWYPAPVDGALARGAARMQTA